MCCFDVHVCGGLDVRCVRFFWLGIRALGLMRMPRFGLDVRCVFHVVSVHHQSAWFMAGFDVFAREELDVKCLF